MGMEFSYSKVGHMLRNRTYIGEYRFKDIVVPDGIPAIIDKEQFERIQKRMKTYKKAPGKAKAHEEYLLTPKLFCGTCGKLMVGECGTSRNKIYKHYYYKCSEAKHKRCSRKKGLKKDWIEKLVVIVTIESILHDDIIDQIAESILKIQGQKDTTIPALQRQLSECEKSIENMVNAIQAGALTPSTTQRLKDLESEKERLGIAICEAKLARPKFSKEYIVQWIKGFQYGDIDNKAYQRRVIDTFVNSVYVYDDRIVFNYNFKDGTVSLSYDEINNAFGSFLEEPAPPAMKKSASALFFHCLMKSCGTRTREGESVERRSGGPSNSERSSATDRGARETSVSEANVSPMPSASTKKTEPGIYGYHVRFCRFYGKSGKAI